MVFRPLTLPEYIKRIVRQFPPSLKPKIRAGLEEISADPYCGKELRNELVGYRSLRVGRFRITYRPGVHSSEIVAIGPRRMIYEETARELQRGIKRDRE